MCSSDLERLDASLRRTRCAPSDAVVLFDGKTLDEWVNTRDGSRAGWTLDGGLLVVDKAAGNIETRRRFRDFQLQDDFALRGETVYIGAPAYVKHGDSPIKLQAHNDASAPLAFRNIWVRALP